MKKCMGFIGAGIAAVIMALTSGCASGGYKLTRKYATFVNGQNIILRIILYIFTTVVFGITMIIDLVVFNTIDFWEGRVSQGDYNFKRGDKHYFVRHELQQNSLRKTTVQVKDQGGKLAQTVELSETPAHEIEMRIDGQLRARVKDILSLPVATIFNKKGQQTQELDLWLEMPEKLVAQR